jgi:hypothetical protein
MQPDTKLILTAPPGCTQQAAAYGLPVGHMAYRVGPGARLLRANLPINLRGGLMVLDGGGFDGRGDAASFCQQVLRECSARGFDGVILDLEGQPHPLLGQIVSRLGALLPRRGWSLYVPEEYAQLTDQAKVIIPSALSGGSLAQRLSEAAQRYGAGRVALGVQRTAEDFTLPSPTGSGVPLSREELSRRIQSRGAVTFFSDELCAHYFTYMSHTSGAHFVLFDNAGSIRKKLHIAQGLGLGACILAWPEVDDILAQILP